MSIPPPGAQAWVKIESYEPSLVRFRVQTPAREVLVLADNYAAGWKASVDGEKAPILPANVVRRGVIVPAGTHTVEMRYEHDRTIRWYWLGAVTLVVGIVAVLGSIVFAFIPRRKQEGLL